MRETLLMIGRILFSLIFIGSGIGHLTQTKHSADYAAFKGVRNAAAMVQLTGVLMVLGGLAIIFGVWADLAALGIAILMLIYAFVMHRFWDVKDPQQRQVEMAGFMKNVSIAGAALILVAVMSVKGFPNTLTDGVFS